MIAAAGNNDDKRPIRVLIATPLGEGGRGGIDRIMDELRAADARAPSGEVKMDFVVTRGQGSILLSPFHLLRAVAALAARPDVLHINLSSHGSTWRKIILARAARLFGVPYVIHLHGSRFRQFWEGAPALPGRLIRGLFSHAARILVLGRVWSEFVANRVPEARDRIRILPNATRAPDHVERRANEAPIILFLGRLGARKGVPELVAALAAIARSDPALAWRAVIAGDGAVEETREAITHADLGARVTIPGWVGPTEAERLLREADILVLPSFDENLPMSVIEGMAHRLAVIATPVGAVEDILAHNETGLLVPPGDPTALAGALERLIREPETRMSLGAAAQKFHTAHLEITPYLAACRAHWRAVANHAS